MSAGNDAEVTVSGPEATRKHDYARMAGATGLGIAAGNSSAGGLLAVDFPPEIE